VARKLGPLCELTRRQHGVEGKMMSN
jgi:hypothetical protein